MRLRVSWAARIGGVAAAAAIAVTGATAVASAATAPVAPVTATAHRVPTHLAAGHTVPVRHAGVTAAVVGGHLTAGRPGVRRYDLRHLRVWLERLGPKGRWLIVNSHLTGRLGRVAFVVRTGARPAAVRLVFRGTPNFGRSVSHILVIRPARAS